MNKRPGRFKKNREYFVQSEQTVQLVRRELNQGLKLLSTIKHPIVTIFGSHLTSPSHANYRHARQLAYELGKSGQAIMTGGGPGIMEAANVGAHQAGARSIGVRAELIRREKVRRHVYTDIINFHFLFVRRFTLSIKSEALVFYPGGYGTLNELFEFLVLMQTGIVDRVPVVAINRQYWSGLFRWMESPRFKKNHWIRRADDLRLVTFADSVAEAKKILLNI